MNAAHAFSRVPYSLARRWYSGVSISDSSEALREQVQLLQVYLHPQTFLDSSNKGQVNPPS